MSGVVRVCFLFPTWVLHLDLPSSIVFLVSLVYRSSIESSVFRVFLQGSGWKALTGARQIDVSVLLTLDEGLIQQPV